MEQTFLINSAEDNCQKFAYQTLGQYNYCNDATDSSVAIYRQFIACPEHPLIHYSWSSFASTESRILVIYITIFYRQPKIKYICDDANHLK